MASADWRNSVCPKMRQIVLEKFIENLSKHAPHAKLTPSKIQEISMNFEEKVYSMATSWEDYLKIISAKGLTIRENTQKSVLNSLRSGSSCTIDPLPDPASQNMNSKLNVQLSPVTVRSGVQGSDNTPVPILFAENLNQQNISGMLQSSVQNSMVPPTISVGHQRQQSLQNQQQGMTSQKNSGHHQSQPPILKQITLETVSGSFQTHTGREGHIQQDQKQLQPVRSQPHHAHSIHRNLLPLMGQRLGTVNVQWGQLINHNSDVAGMQQHGKNHVNSFGNSSMQQDAVSLQRQAKHSASVSLQVQGQHSHPQPQKEHLASHSKPANLQQAFKLSQQDMQHRLHTSDTDCCVSTKEHLSLERDRKEKALAKIEHLKMRYLQKLNAYLHWLLKLIESSGSQPQKPGYIEELTAASEILVNVISFLENPSDINSAFDRLERVEQRIIIILNCMDNLYPLPASHAHRQMTQDEKKPLLHSSTTVHHNNEGSLLNGSLSTSSQQNNMHMQQQQQHTAGPHSKVGIAVGFQPIAHSTRLQPDGSTSQSTGQRSSYPHHRSIAGTLSFASSSEPRQAVTPHTKNKSYQPGSLVKAGTALYNRNSPSMSTSRELRDSKKLSCDVFSLSNGGNDKNQQMKGAVEPPRGGVSTSPLLVDSNDTQSYPSTGISDESSVAGQPIQRLLKVMSSMSANALRASVSEIGSIVSVTDRMAEVPTQFEKSESDIGEDMWIMTKCHLQSRFFTDMDFSLETRKMKRGTSQIPLDIVACAGGIHSLDSTTSCIDRPSVNTNHSLLEEIQKVNRQLIDTVVDISDETTSGVDEGTIVTCSFRTPNIMTSSLFLRVLVPINYPSCSPILLDKSISGLSETEDVAEKAKRKVEESLALVHPFSIGDIAKTWDHSARAVVLELAMQCGGGTFTSKYGAWDKYCLTLAS